LSGSDPGEAQFINGTGPGARTLTFTIRQGSTTATFPSAVAIKTGTVAGTITISAALQVAGTSVTPNPNPVRITIDAAPPVITSVQLQQVTGGVNVIVTGYSTPREVTTGTFHFAVATGQTLQTSDFTVSLTSVFTAYYAAA